MTNDLRAERRERIRSQERAEVAAHLHDSVLQTLDADPEGRRLTDRGAPAGPRSGARAADLALRRPSARGLADRCAAQPAPPRSRRRHRVPVDVVTVGDLELDERSTALMAATREAVLNAARHSGAASIDVYAEVEPAAVNVFVRDRGCGFDPDTVPADRHGLVGSIKGRMKRHGGSGRRCGPRPATAPRCGWSCPHEAADRQPAVASGAGDRGAGRRPPHVPHRGPCRDRRPGRHRRRSRDRRGGGRRHHAAETAGRAARRAPARRRRAGGHRRRRRDHHAVPRAVGVATPPRT